MLQSAGSGQGERKRPMTENELRVLRSLQKLSIPDWYLNKSSRPPKILSNHTPIDQRPPSWKIMPVKECPVIRTTIEQSADSTVSRDGLPAKEIKPSSSGDQSSAKNETDRISPIEKLFRSETKVSLAKSQTTSQRFENSKCLMITDFDGPETTFVDTDGDSLYVTNFTSTKYRRNDTESCHDAIDDENSTEKTKTRMRTELKFEVTQSDEFPAVQNFKTTAATEPHESLVSNVSGSNFNATIGKKHQRQSSISFAMFDSSVRAITASAENDEPRIESALLRARRSDRKSDAQEEREKAWRTIFRIYTTDLDAKSKEEDQNEASESSNTIDVSAFETPPAEVQNKESSLNSLVPIFDNNETSSMNRKLSKSECSLEKQSIAISSDENCDSWQVKFPKVKRASPTRALIGFRPKNLLPPILEKSYDSQSCLSSTDDTDSSMLQENLANDESSVLSKSLGSEIVEMLNERCKISPQSTYVNFTKKVMRALENIENRDYAEEGCTEDDAFNESENASEDDVKSPAISTSISYKDSDSSSSSSSSSDTDNGSPTIKHNYDTTFDWNMNLHKSSDLTLVTSNDHGKKNENHSYTENDSSFLAKDDEDSVYWTKVTECDLPRTSSFLSIQLGLSANSPGFTSPSISPIDRLNCPGKVYSYRPAINAWGTSYMPDDRQSSRPWRLSDTTILDSGYSDRSSIRSSRSSYVDDNNYANGFDCTEIAQTSSVIASCSSDQARDLKFSNTRQTRAQIHGRSIVI